jgi:molecular chaperone DnaJ
VDHYARLGISTDADADAVRDAYRRAARRHHPDAPGGDVSTMAAVNEAWRVLGDPQLRRDYDRQLRPSTSSSERTAPTTRATHTEYRPPAPVAPAKVPWRLLTWMAIGGIALVAIGVVTAQPSTPLAPDNLLQSGSCVDIGPAGDAFEVSCSAPHAGVVEQLVPFDGQCRPPAVPHRDRQGMGVACVRFDNVAGG